MYKIGVLAVQGAFAEHANMLRKLGVEPVEIRKKEDMEQNFDGLILPGGESTVMGKLIKELGIEEKLRALIKNGVPVLATCAGLILLAEHIENEAYTYLGTMPVTVERNAYGRQLGSFSVEAKVSHIGKIALRFIRAPYVKSADREVEILATVDDRIVAVRYQNQLGMAFHPELTEDESTHAYFLQIVNESRTTK